VDNLHSSLGAWQKGVGGSSLPPLVTSITWTMASLKSGTHIRAHVLCAIPRACCNFFVRRDVAIGDGLCTAKWKKIACVLHPDTFPLSPELLLTLAASLPKVTPASKEWIDKQSIQTEYKSK
jgi:hypothetical protein